MPSEIRLWQIEDERPMLVTQDKLNFEDRLEKWLRQDIGLIDDGILVIGQQVKTEDGGGIDLLAIDSSGDLVILELKRDKTPREVVAQILDYASWVQRLNYADVVNVERVSNLFGDKESFERAFSEKFEEDFPDPEVVNSSHRMYIVASSLDPTTERIVEYLSETHGVEINVAIFTYFKTGDVELIGRSMLSSEDDVQRRVQTGGRPQPKRLTFTEWGGVAWENDVSELWKRSLDGFTSLTHGRRTDKFGAHFTVPIEGGGQVLSVFPSDSSPVKGIAVRIQGDRISEYFNIRIDQIKAVCGETSDIPGRKVRAGASDHFFDEKRLDEFIDLLQNANN